MKSCLYMTKDEKGGGEGEKEGGRDGQQVGFRREQTVSINST